MRLVSRPPQVDNGRTVVPDREENGTQLERLARIERKLDRIYYWAFGYEQGERSVARTVRDIEEWIDNRDEIIKELSRDLSARAANSNETTRARRALWIAVAVAILSIIGNFASDIIRTLVFLGGQGGTP
jgi:hypothetical protein